MWTTPFGGGGGGGGGGKGGGAAGRAPLVGGGGGDWSENWSDEEDWDGGEGGASKAGHAR
jgi:ATP-dependent RNA helicase RhlE